MTHQTTQEKVDGDASLQLLRDRMLLLDLASDPATSDSASKKLHVACLQDPFLKELKATILSDGEGVQSIGRITYVRNTLLELQPSGQKVIELMDQQRNALAVLTNIINCVEKEAASWKTGVVALSKAYAEEEKARKKALEKEQKDKLQKKARLEKAAARAEKRKREQEEKQQAAAAAGSKEGEDAEEEGEDREERPTTLRRRRTGHAAGELDESDPSVLRCLRVCPKLIPTAIHSTIPEFLEHVCRQPQEAVVLRLKKGMVKKVLAVTCPFQSRFHKSWVSGQGSRVSGLMLIKLKDSCLQPAACNLRKLQG